MPEKNGHDQHASSQAKKELVQGKIPDKDHKNRFQKAVPACVCRNAFSIHGAKKSGSSALRIQAVRASDAQRSGLTARRVALETLMDVAHSGAFASLALNKRLAVSGLSAQDRAFATRLVYGTIENRIQLDWRIDLCLDKENELESTVREILRMGAFQIFRMDRVPDMAAVNESVALTRAMGLEGFTGFVNAVLRSLIRDKNRIIWPDASKEPIRYLSITYSAPDELCRLLIDAYGTHEAMEILQDSFGEHPTVLRVNRMRCTPGQFERLLEEERITWKRGIIPCTYRVRGTGDLTALRGYQNGLFTIQGESSVLAALAVHAEPGQIILDACAAPGGKSAVLSENMEDSGRVIAWDIHPHRVELIKKTALRLHLDNVRPMLRDASQPRPEMAGTLDAALIDAPCSGTGVLFEKPDLKYRITSEEVHSLCELQQAILTAVAPMLKPGGTIVYSTCSILPLENCKQIRTFLRLHPEYERFSLGEDLPEQLRGREGPEGLQLLPHRDGMEGFFICRMRRKRE